MCVTTDPLLNGQVFPVTRSLAAAASARTGARTSTRTSACASARCVQVCVEQHRCATAARSSDVV